MKKIYILFIILFFYKDIAAQQDAQYTQYMYNMSVVNPAYATANLGVVNFGTLYRTQWAGAVGAPKTLTFFAHTPFNKKVELGLSLISDDIGDGLVKENNFYADFAYLLKLDEKHSLSLGIKAGISTFDTNFNGLRLPEFQDDVAFNDNINSSFPNIGIGAFYFAENYYAGISAPNLLSSKHLENNEGIAKIGAEEIHVFITGGYVLELNDQLKFKPSFMARGVKGAPLVFDISANVLFNDRFEGGLSYRLDDSVSALFNIKALPSMRIGYAYDYTLSNLGSFNSGSHEIFVLFDLDLRSLKKGYDKSPRFF